MKIKTAISVCFVALTLLVSFNSSAQTITKGAKPVVSILGDSYSTFEDYIPVGNETWYSDHMKADRSDLNSVRQTWWWQLISEGGYILGKNDSYSGATICNTGYRHEDYSDRSFLTRVNRLGSPDIILIFGGTNDSWAGVKLGEYMYNQKIPGEELYKFRPALTRLLIEAQNLYPGTDIYFILNSELKEEINTSVKEICGHYSVPVIILHDIEKRASHPTVAGMRAIADQVLEVLNGNTDSNN